MSSAVFTLVHFHRENLVIRFSPDENKGNYVRFEGFTAVTVKNAAFWDIETQFLLHRKHITSLLQSPAG
jgi:hypothetical protein